MPGSMRVPGWEGANQPLTRLPAHCSMVGLEGAGWGWWKLQTNHQPGCLSTAVCGWEGESWKPTTNQVACALRYEGGRVEAANQPPTRLPADSSMRVPGWECGSCKPTTNQVACTLLYEGGRVEAANQPLTRLPAHCSMRVWRVGGWKLETNHQPGCLCTAV